MFFFFNDTATTEIYTLSLHDALPISRSAFYRMSPLRSSLITQGTQRAPNRAMLRAVGFGDGDLDRKSTRLNSSHGYISYAVFCLKKKKTPRQTHNHHDQSHYLQEPTC